MAFDVFNQGLIVRRQQGDWVNGRYVPSAPTEIAIEASVQPASGADLQTLEEGRSKTAVYKMFSATELFIATEKGSQADIVLLHNDEYEVLRCAKWGNDVISHYEILVGRKLNS